MVRVNNFHGGVHPAAVANIKRGNQLAAGIQAGVKRNAAGKTGKTMVDVSSNIEFTEKVLRQLPIQIREQSLRKAHQAAARVVEKQTRLLLKQSGRREAGQGTFPANSKKTGTYDKKSKPQKAARDLRKSLVQSIRQKTLPKKGTGTARLGLLTMVGPKRPEGSAAFILEYGGVIRLWGSDRFYRLKPRPFLGPAGKTTKWQQHNAYVAVMKEQWQHHARYWKKYGGYMK